MTIKDIIVAIIGAVDLAATIITLRDFINKDEKRFKTLVFAIALAVPLLLLLRYDPGSIGDPTNSYAGSVITETGSFQPLSQGAGGNNIGSKPGLVNISFTEHWFDEGQKFKVYTAPSSSAWYSKTNEGKQVYASTNKEVYIAGWVGNWLLIKYKLSNSNKYRMGYTIEANGNFPSLTLNDYTGIIISDCYLTDGVDSYNLCSGTQVRVLGQVGSDIYIETTIKEKRARGTVPKDCVDW